MTNDVYACFYTDRTVNHKLIVVSVAPGKFRNAIVSNITNNLILCNNSLLYDLRVEIKAVKRSRGIGVDIGNKLLVQSAFLCSKSVISL